MRTALPNFRGQRAFVLHWNDNNRATLVRQLETVGLKVEVQWPAENVSADGYDVIFFDADQGYDGLFDWQPDQPPIPLIAMMGSEAPGRIEWTLSRAPSAYLVKPIGSTGVFSALAIAFRTFETQRELKDTIAALNRRVVARPTVFKAILLVMAHFEVDDDDAYQLLRAESMNQRLSIEELCELVASNGEAELTRMAIRIKGRMRKVNRG
jgi:AmiR/NasT family two-component response regulator